MGSAPGISGMPLMHGISVAVEIWRVISLLRAEVGDRLGVHDRGHKKL
jgi:hypothetical protein